MRIAIVHDYLVQMGGAEKVVEVLHDMFPEAPIYTSLYDAKAMPQHYREWNIHTSFLQRMLMKQRTHRMALLLYPAAFESFDLSHFDVVISSSSAFAKGIVTQPHTVHICYTYTPMRFAWTTRNYMHNERVSMVFRSSLTPAMHYLRTWDALSAMRVDKYIAISDAVATRIDKFYRRDSEVIHPPVDVNSFEIASDIGDYYLMASRFAPYKRLDLAIQAFNLMKRPLKILGSGRQIDSLKKQAGRNIEFLGRVSDEDLRRLMSRAKAYIMPGEEDFGLAPVEANACGRPVIAYARGGALDTQIDGLTGVLFDEQTVSGICDAVQLSDSIEFDPHEIRRHAEKFDTSVFREKLMHVVQNCRVMRPRKKIAYHTEHEPNLEELCLISHRKQEKVIHKSLNNASNGYLSRPSTVE